MESQQRYDSAIYALRCALEKRIEYFEMLRHEIAVLGIDIKTHVPEDDDDDWKMHYNNNVMWCKQFVEAIRVLRREQERGD